MQRLFGQLLVRRPDPKEHANSQSPEEWELPERPIGERRKYLLGRYDEMIRWYEKEKRWKRRFHQSTQVLIIVFGATLPVLLLLVEPDPSDAFRSKVLTVGPAAVAALTAIIAALSGLYRWQENYLRFAATAEALKSENAQYVTRSASASPDAEKDLSDFRGRAEDLLMREV